MVTSFVVECHLPAKISIDSVAFSIKFKSVCFIGALENVVSLCVLLVYQSKLKKVKVGFVCLFVGQGEIVKVILVKVKSEG